jgi:hypothetical protein
VIKIIGTFLQLFVADVQRMRMCELTLLHQLLNGIWYICFLGLTLTGDEEFILATKISEMSATKRK